MIINISVKLEGHQDRYTLANTYLGSFSVQEQRLVLSRSMLLEGGRLPRSNGVLSVRGT